MAEDNLQVVARIFDSWEAGDFSVGLDDLDPNVTFVAASPFPSPESSSALGRSANSC